MYLHRKLSDFLPPLIAINRIFQKRINVLPRKFWIWRLCDRGVDSVEDYQSYHQIIGASCFTMIFLGRTRTERDPIADKIGQNASIFPTFYIQSSKLGIPGIQLQVTWDTYFLF